MAENGANKKVIGYWVATGVTCLVMGGGGIGDLLRVEDLQATMENLGYPMYLLTILGVAKLLGVITVLAPGFTRLKEWAYAGFTFDLLGAFLSHLAVKDPIKDTDRKSVV